MTLATICQFDTRIAEYERAIRELSAAMMAHQGRSIIDELERRVYALRPRPNAMIPATYTEE